MLCLKPADGRASRRISLGPAVPRRAFRGFDASDSIARKRRYAEDPGHRQRVLACDRRFHATRQDDINEHRGANGRKIPR
jgi:hypothetical protein